MNARFIVCEKTGDWAVALRWAERHHAMRVHELRSLIDCRQEWQRAPGGVFALETSLLNLEGVLRLILEMRTASPPTQVIVLGSAEIQPWENLLREAGAIHVLYSTRRLEPVVRLAQRRLEAIDQATAARSNRSLRDLVWSRLPWGES